MRIQTILGALLGMLVTLASTDAAFGQLRARAAVRNAIRAGVYDGAGWNPGMYTGWNWAYPLYGDRQFYNNGWNGSSSYGWPGYSNYYSPGWWGGNYSSYYYPSSTYYYPGSNYYAPSTNYVPAHSGVAALPQQSQSFYPSAGMASLVHLRVHVPDPNAQVNIQDQPMQTAGTTRLFVSPPLEQGTYTYTVKATWMQNGQQHSEVQKIDVQPGQNFDVVFPQQQGRQRMPEATQSPPRIKAGALDDDRERDRSERRDRSEIRPTAIEGAFVRTADGRIFITTAAGQQQSLTLARDVHVTVDGREVRLEEIRQGSQLSIQTTGAGDAATVTKIEAKTKAAPQK